MKQYRVQDIKDCFNIAIVVSRFNSDITDKLLEGALGRLKELEFQEDQIAVAWVPGAVELPIVAQQFADTENFDAIVCLGSVIRGETSHYDYVCEQASQGCQQVALEHDLPVIFGVLTTETKAQALDRAGGDHGHKGREAVDAAYEVVSVIDQINDDDLGEFIDLDEFADLEED